MKTIKAILIFCLTFTATGILFELLLTYGGIMTPIIEIDKEKGERYIPNKICNSVFINEGFGLARTNATGWFGKAFKDNGNCTVSVAVMGNSYVAARQVFYRNNFLSIAEEKINSGQSVNHTAFFNFGKESVALREALYIKNEIDSTFNPDYFLVALNDSIFGSQGRYIPYYDLINDSLQLNSSFKQSAFMKKYDKLKFLTKSSLFFLTYRVKNRLPQAEEILLDRFYVSRKSNKPPADFSQVDAVDIAILKKLAEDKRVIFLLDLGPLRREKVKELIKGAYVIDLHEPLQKLKQQGINPYYWEVTSQIGHWNRYAHNVVGEEIAKHMKDFINSNWSVK